MKNKNDLIFIYIRSKRLV